jgi:hypothetical protein
MPYVRRGAGYRRGMGQSSSDLLLAAENLPSDAVFGTPVYDPTTGEYQGGNFWDSWYCNSVLGQIFSPQTCAIPSTNQQASIEAAELSSTSAPPAVQAAAIAAGSQAVTAACTGDPSDCAAQNAAAQNPYLSSLFGPSVTASMLGMQANGTINPLSGWGIYALGGAFALIIATMLGKR